MHCYYFTQGKDTPIYLFSPYRPTSLQTAYVAAYSSPLGDAMRLGRGLFRVYLPFETMTHEYFLFLYCFYFLVTH